MTISKELFEAVKGFKVNEFVVSETHISYFNTSSPRAKCINWKPTLEVVSINDFFFECKAWALTHKYKIISKPDNIPGLYEAYINLTLTINHGEIADSEQQAVFYACQWVLDRGTTK